MILVISELCRNGDIRLSSSNVLVDMEKFKFVSIIHGTVFVIVPLTEMMPVLYASN